MEFDFARLSRHPDVEAPNLHAVDAADRLILDEADAGRPASGAVAVIGDAYGALTLGAATRWGLPVRTHQDGLVGERALAANAADAGLSDAYASFELEAGLLADVQLVLLRLPRSLDALDEIAADLARWAAPEVVVVAGGMVKHMTPAMNDVLRRRFARLDVSHARQKARVLIARDVLPAEASAPPEWPASRVDPTTGLTVVAHGAAFAGATVDVGTRFLLPLLADAVPDARDIIDLGCGTGVIAASLARSRPQAHVRGTDQSAAAVASARLTAEANGVAVAVARDDGLGAVADASADLIVLNPPFHIGAAVHTGIALKLFADAARVLRPGGELWCVWNSHLQYRPQLERIVGPTRQIARNRTFTVTASARRR
ncbi:SAM-dependent methyltransferase [Microbacterium mangrovi]|uniref:SAM-dependent methyltransferase n=1 Tax=Microbacterium mangrovi TaxID=1348253 RepID=A0A0B2A2Y1_9MICO|nr:class I SAM-dependent methyltransferase [Microbacterium mangrovi]KHK95933.1 SAM-dependent methyltransferase [Microbacterium mangrovi]